MRAGLRERVDGLTLLAVVAAGCYCLALAVLMNRTGYDTWGALVVAPVLVALSLPLVRLAVAHEADPRVAVLLPWFFALKLLASQARYWVLETLYGFVGDGARYASSGSAEYKQFQHLDFSGVDWSHLVGTHFLDVITGAVYALTGPTIVGGFVVFSWISFWGLYFCYKAFALAVPDGDRHRYALLVFLLPSMLFWPSSIGKEAWVSLGIGLSAYGAARVFTRLRGGYLLLGLGLGEAALVRPHITLLLLAAMVAGYLVRPFGEQRNLLSPIYKVLGLAVLCAGLVLVLHQATSYLSFDNGDGGSVTGALNTAEHRTGQGGSAFQAVPIHSPTQVPGAVATVLFRPFPWEAHNIQALLSAAEGAFLLLLALRSWPRLRSLRRLLRRPFATMSLAYVLCFVYAYSTFGNFGILARQRVQVFPFVIALFCLPVLNRAGRHADPSLPYQRRPERSLVTQR